MIRLDQFVGFKVIDFDLFRIAFIVVVFHGCSFTIIGDGCYDVGIFGRSDGMYCLGLAVWREYDQIVAVHPVELTAVRAVSGVKAFFRDGNGARAAIIEIDERYAL